MLNFLRRRRYKKKVFEALYALLNLYPRGRNYIIKDYPGVLDVIKAHYAENNSPQYSAIFISTSILTNLIEQLTNDERSIVMQQLQQLDTRQLALRDQVAEKPTNYSALTIMLGASMAVAKAFVDSGKIYQHDCDRFSSEVMGALAGKSSEQRLSEQLSAAQDEIVGMINAIGDEYRDQRPHE